MLNQLSEDPPLDIVDAPVQETGHLQERTRKKRFGARFRACPGPVFLPARDSTYANLYGVTNDMLKKIYFAGGAKVSGKSVRGKQGLGVIARKRTNPGGEKPVRLRTAVRKDGSGCET